MQPFFAPERLHQEKSRSPGLNPARKPMELGGTVSTTIAGAVNGQRMTVAAGVSGCTGDASAREALRVAAQKTFRTRCMIRERSLSPISIERESRPVVRMLELALFRADQVELRGPQGFVFRLALPEIGIETFHEDRGRRVGDTPQRGENRAGAGELEGADQADEALSSHLPAEP